MARELSPVVRRKGVPCVRGTGIPAVAITAAFAAGISIKQLARLHDLGVELVSDVIRWGMGRRWPKRKGRRR